MINERSPGHSLADAYRAVTGLSLADHAMPGVVEVDRLLLKTVFQKIELEFTREKENQEKQVREVQLQLDELRNSYAKLSSEFESKFEKNKTISLSIPGGANLAVDQKDEDSVKSFMPDSDDDSDDIRRREDELRSKLAQQKIEEQKLLFNCPTRE